MKILVDKHDIEEFSKGNPKALENLFIKYQPRLIIFINGFIKNHEVARDISQNIFLKIWQERKQYRHVINFQAFLYTMARNAIYNHFDHELVKARYTEKQLLRPVITDNIEESVFAQQLQELIEETISKMPTQRRKIFVMSRYQGLSNTEIAEELSISKRTVENHLTTALADIRKSIKTAIAIGGTALITFLH